MSVWEGALRDIIWGTKAEMGNDDMTATCRAVYLCMWKGMVSISHVTKISPHLFPQDSVSLGFFFLREKREPFKMSDIADCGKWGSRVRFGLL